MDLMKPMQVRWSWVPFGSGWSWGLKLWTDWNWWNCETAQSATMERRVLRVFWWKFESLNFGKVLRVVSWMVKEKMGRPHWFFRLEALIRYLFNSSWWQLKHFLMFNPKIGEDEPNYDEHIFQMAWFSHPTSYSMHQKFREVLTAVHPDPLRQSR